MDIIKRNRNFSNTFPALFDDFFNRDVFDWRGSNFSSTGTTLPAVNIEESDDNFEVQVAAPGMKKDDFKVQLDGNYLTISSETSTESENGERRR